MPTGFSRWSPRYESAASDMAKHQGKRSMERKIKALEKQGMRVHRTGNGHFRVLHPDGERTAQFSGATQDGGSAKNIKAALKRLDVQNFTA